MSTVQPLGTVSSLGSAGSKTVVAKMKSHHQLSGTRLHRNKFDGSNRRNPTRIRVYCSHYRPTSHHIEKQTCSPGSHLGLRTRLGTTGIWYWWSPAVITACAIPFILIIPSGIDKYLILPVVLHRPTIPNVQPDC